MFQFMKYQSLGNDFILLDWLDRSTEQVNQVLQRVDWCERVQAWCQRHFGIGADGVLIVKKTGNQIEGLIFNADGSQAERCLNGLRCIAHYLLMQKQYRTPLWIRMGDDDIRCQLVDHALISLLVKDVHYGEIQAIEIMNQSISGHCVNVGNPHFVVCDQISEDWLAQSGGQFGKNPLFPKGTNVEYVWYDSVASAHSDFPVYQMLVYERGCGITLACGTGAAAVARVLHEVHQINLDEKIMIQMSGGQLISWVSDQGVTQVASAQMVFKGDLSA